jgi:tetratricopeptide (TPR) repeat protein
MWQAEDCIGQVYGEMQDYPKALAHFEKAGAMSNSSANQAYVTFSTADVLWKLGRYSESDALLRMTPSDEKLAIWVIEARVSSLLSRARYAEALNTAQQAIHGTPKLSEEDRAELDTDRMLALAHLGSKAKLLPDDPAHSAGISKPETPMDHAKQNLAYAEISLWTGHMDDAYTQAIEAADYFASTHQADSELRSFALAAQSAKKLGRLPEYKSYSDKVLDIESQIQQTWGSKAADLYFSRPDLKLLLR